MKTLTHSDRTANHCKYEQGYGMIAPHQAPQPGQDHHEANAQGEKDERP